MPETDDSILLLAKPMKKGILRILFSRTFLILLLVLIQVFLFLGLFRRFSEWAKWFPVVEVIFLFCTLLYLLNSSMDATAKITWFFLIALFPLPAALFLAYSKLNLGHRALSRRVQELIGNTQDLLPQEKQVLSDVADGSGTDHLLHYVGRSGCMPMFRNTEVTYFPSGEAKFKAMLEELEKAEKFIFFEYFIIEEGVMWGKILKILAEKAKAGVDVRVMYDGMCVISNLPYNYPELLGNLGIKAKLFSPLRPVVSTHYNYRDHRKILAIDNRVAFNGGVNLADEYINEKERFGHWKDTAVMLRGEAAKSFTLMFLQMWNVTEKTPDFSPARLPGLSVPEAKGFVLPYGDVPLDEDKVGESVYIDMLYRAERYVHIMTPYLILDGELETALKYAAERGIDVKLILPGIPDKKAAYALAKTHYPSLLQAGVEVYEYVPGFVHAKVAVSDDKKAVVGTINLDYRSLYHHFECATYLYQVPCIGEIEADFEETLEKCRQVSRETILRDPVYYKIVGPLMKVVAPMM